MSLSVRNSASAIAGGAITSERASAMKCWRAFSLIELIVVIGIISVLAALVLAALAAGKAEAQFAGCKGNLRQIGLALAMYVGDCASYPLLAESSQGGPWWDDRLNEYLAQPLGGGGPVDPVWKTGLWLCPGDKSPGLFWNGTFHPGWRWSHGSYGYNRSGISVFRNESLYPSLGLSGWLPDGRVAGGKAVPVREGEVAIPSDMLALGDNFSKVGVNLRATSLYRIDEPIGPFKVQEDPFSPYRRHRKKMNIGFCDGHIEGTAIQRMMFDRTDAVLRRWNIDHEPHWERVK